MVSAEFVNSKFQNKSKEHIQHIQRRETEQKKKRGKMKKYAHINH